GLGEAALLGDASEAADLLECDIRKHDMILFVGLILLIMLGRVSRRKSKRDSGDAGYGDPRA
ncbi:hypothetical protein, partial [Klebsiella pneumoniae]|uniref:hypothetical protein n=1 Tax=Klebsiella pneumoniae TaxID=573 RepID=UPI0019542448